MRLRREDPRLVGPYRLHRRLGAGGMGVVYLGSDRKGQKVALKLIRAELAGDAEFRTRFAREVAAAARIRGGCIARLVSSDIDAERPWLATVYVPGPSLYKQVGDEGPLPWAEVAAIGSALADGLEQVHEAGVVHRDLKPSNILLSPKGPRIIDFGIAWSSGASTLTHVGTAVGSPGFLAPEQVRGVGVTGATDVFALGSTLAYAATGDTPFGSGSSEVMLYRVVHEEPDLTGVPAALAPLIRACLAKDPADRPTPVQIHDRLRELAARGAAIGRSIAPQTHGGQGHAQAHGQVGAAERADRPADAHAVGSPAGPAEARGERYGEGHLPGPASGPGAGHGTGGHGTGSGVGVGLGERQSPARGAAAAGARPQAGVPRGGASTAGRSGARPSGALGASGVGAVRPGAPRRPLPPTVREPVEHSAPARRPGETPRGATPCPGGR
uniref:serine/threonine-protein kinase n=1 Tax=Streptacidiphilus melanogenes TaxID=411235 RepID=UPI001269D9B3